MSSVFEWSAPLPLLTSVISAAKLFSIQATSWLLSAVFHCRSISRRAVWSGVDSAKALATIIVVARKKVFILFAPGRIVVDRARVMSRQQFRRIRRDHRSFIVRSRELANRVERFPEGQGDEFHFVSHIPAQNI